MAVRPCVLEWVSRQAIYSLFQESPIVSAGLDVCSGGLEPPALPATVGACLSWAGKAREKSGCSDKPRRKLIAWTAYSGRRQGQASRVESCAASIRAQAGGRSVTTGANWSNGVRDAIYRQGLLPEGAWPPAQASTPRPRNYRAFPTTTMARQSRALSPRTCCGRRSIPAHRW